MTMRRGHIRLYGERMAPRGGINYKRTVARTAVVVVRAEAASAPAAE